MIEWPRMVVPKLAQRVRNTVGTLGEGTDRIVERLPFWQGLQDRESGPEHWRIVLFQDQIPSGIKRLLRILGSGHLVETLGF